MAERLDWVDMLCQESDHTGNQMTFEFEQAMRKLAPNSVIVADDITRNASLWDLAERPRPEL
jgi:hypothetical protein